MFRQFERDFSYQTYGEDQESIRGLEAELESEYAESLPESGRICVNCATDGQRQNWRYRNLGWENGGGPEDIF